jgi:SAM-dependent methyltransferase
MLYDDQAQSFDARAGLPDGAAEAVARELAEAAGLRAGDLLVEVGAGTGALVMPLLATGIRYLGFDRSPAMVEVFRARVAEAGAAADLRVADGDARWPAEDGAAAAVFSSRALHHLRPEHAAAEARRVLRPGGALVVGRVRRPPDSPKSLLRREMRRLLAADGIAGRSGDGAAAAVLEHLAAGGAQVDPPRVVARWSTPHRPAASLESWARKDGLAGVDVEPAVKARVLAAARRWAEARFGDLGAPIAQDEWYELQSVRVPG